MRDRLVELIRQGQTNYFRDNRMTMCESIADILLANDVVALPCKFLQRVYVIPTIENRLSDVTEMKCIGFTLSHDAYCVNLMNEKNKLYQPAFGMFGKTVFLTREEVERALKGGG